MAIKVYIIVYFSMFGLLGRLAEEIQKGAASVEGVEATLWQVPETLHEEVMGKMSAPPKIDIPIITVNQFAEADGFILGFPTRFGVMAPQFKAFLDSTDGLWRTQQLAGKPAGIFYSTGSQGGGQETTVSQLCSRLLTKLRISEKVIDLGLEFRSPLLSCFRSSQLYPWLLANMGISEKVLLIGLDFGSSLLRCFKRCYGSTGSQGGGQETAALTAITQLVNHSMIFVPHKFGDCMFEMENVKGGSPYGAATFAGDGSRQPTELELKQAFDQGKYIAGITKKLKGSA